MKKSRYTPDRVVYALKQAASGAETVASICRKMGVSEATFNN
jgi:transposase-like protein